MFSSLWNTSWRNVPSKLHHRKGVAMGTRMGPSYANLFLGYLEDKMFQSYQSVPEMFLRYIDDILRITSMAPCVLNNWIDLMQNLHPSIDFTVDISNDKVTFLDAEFRNVQGQLVTSVHYKPTDSHSYLRYDSFHPKPTKDAIPFSQFLRLRRLWHR